MANKTKLKIITPHGIFYDKEVYIVTVATTEGRIGLQHGKSPFIGSIAISELSIREDQGKKEEIFAIDGGLVYVTTEAVKIITDGIEAKDKIDINKARKEKELAETKLKQKLDEVEQRKLQISLQKSINKINIKQHK